MKTGYAVNAKIYKFVKLCNCKVHKPVNVCISMQKTFIGPHLRRLRLERG